MKELKYFNTFAILLPFFIGAFGCIDESYLIIALISTILTGCIQIIIGMSFAFLFPKNKNIKIYLLLVVLFFVLLFTNLGEYWVWLFPPLLCLYLTITLYEEKQ
jgi:hypothetical protein